MFEIIKRICRVMAIVAVYIICAYGYLTTKGFIFKDNNFILSNTAHAGEQSFAQKISGNINLSEERTRALGSPDAPLTMYGYSSMACSHCREFHKFTLPKLERDFIATGKLKFVFIHFPIEPLSMRAAKLSYCLPQEKFYDFISDLYDNRDWLFSNDETKIYEHAKAFGMKDEDIEACNADKKLTSDILLVKENAINDFKIAGTPAFIISGADGQELILGSKKYDDLKEYLEKRLGGE